MNGKSIDDILVIGLNDCGTAGLREWRRLEALLPVVDCLRAGRIPEEKELRSLRASLQVELQKEPLKQRGEGILAEAEALGLSWTTCQEDDFPPALMNLANPPLVLFHRGSLPQPGPRRIAVVGARRASRYGLEQASKFSAVLARRGVEIVSGLARGVDRRAHQAALDAGGTTHGILGCGLLRIYPAEHQKLSQEMAESGSVISEFSPAMPPLPGNFPRRNRLIAALADAVLLIEAGEKSGGLITVRWANDLGKEVFVLPGQVDNPAAQGCLSLLRDGAVLTRSAEDILDDLNWDLAEEGQLEFCDLEEEVLLLEAPERRVLALLDHEAMELETLLASLDMGPGEVLTRLLALELKGQVVQESGLRFRRSERALRS